MNQQEWEVFTQMLAPIFPDTFSQNSDSNISPNFYQKLRQKVIDQKTAVAYFAPRGLGLSSWNPDKKKQIQIKRRFYLLGQSLEGMQIWDIRRAIQELNAQPNLSNASLALKASGIVRS